MPTRRKMMMIATPFALVVSVILLAFIAIFINEELNAEEPIGEDLYTWERQFGGFERPVYMTHAGDERLFVVEQGGQIFIVADGQRLDTPFLDVREKVTRAGNEQGLLSLAFHPSYAENGYFFINYTGRDGGTTHVERYQVSADNPNLADPASAETVISIEQPYGNHNGGLLKFGADGYLYIGMGDGGSGGDPENRAVNLETLLGKMLRLDVDELPYSIPPDNPFVGVEGARDEIWAYGLRNPWRFSFDAETADLYIADVGQNAIEEVNFQPAESAGGEHYGWRLFEGNEAFRGDAGDRSAYTFPIHDYGHGELIPLVEKNITQTAHCSVTGGYVYRGAEIPALQGQYLYGDFCSGYFWTLWRDDGGQWVNELLLLTDFTIASFAEDASNELYLVAFSGEIYKLVEK